MDQEQYSSFSLRVHQEALARGRVPITATLELTRRCNNHCVHCYTNLPANDPEQLSVELDLEAYGHLFDELVELGTIWVLLTGGEPFLRPDFLEIYKEAKRRGFLVTIFTNGTLLDEPAVDVLAEYRPFLIEITLYGHTRETYEEVTGVPGSFARCRQGVKLALEQGLPLRLKSTVLKQNVHEVKAMQRWAENLGLSFRFDAMINPRIDGDLSPLAARLEPKDVVALDAVDARRKEEWERFCERHDGLPVEKGASRPLYNCGAGMTTLAVDPAGRITLCGMDRADGAWWEPGNLRGIWEGFVRERRQTRATRRTRCTDCSLQALCGICPAYSFMEMGDPEAPVDFLCHVAHLRAGLLGREVRPHGDCPFCRDGVLSDRLQEELRTFREGPIPSQ